MTYIRNFSLAADELAEHIASADAVLVGAGAGMSASAGFSYSGKRFREHFADFERKFGFHDMYSGGFYPFPDEETAWAYWSRMILVNRYDLPAGKPYEDLLALLSGSDYFVLTTNVDHRFQTAGFDKDRLFYTQGDYGLFQCSVPCHKKTYDNESAVREMVAKQHDMRIPEELAPRCPVCGAPMTVNLRSDDTFVEDDGWHAACGRYEEFLRRHAKKSRLLLLELGVGYNTPGIIKYPFMRMTAENPNATYFTINAGEAYCPDVISDRAVCADADIAAVLGECAERRHGGVK